MTDLSQNFTVIEYRKTDIGPKKGHMISVTLNRPQLANAFNGPLLDELRQALAMIKADQNCRLVVLSGKGRNFCGGADLSWMQSFAKLSLEENQREARMMSDLFESLYRLPVPTFAVVRGAAFGGAVGLVAACDVVVASTDARFCLSEVKVGLLPAVILPYVAKKLNAGQLRRHMLSGRVISAAEALDFGLVERVCAADDLSRVLREEVDLMLLGSPDAQRSCKTLLQDLVDDGLVQSDMTADTIAAIRITENAQNGIRDFFNKQEPSWVARLKADWQFDA